MQIVKNVIDVLNGEMPERTRTPNISWSPYGRGRTCSLILSGGRRFHAWRVEYYASPGDGQQFCDYEIDHDHWKRAKAERQPVYKFEQLPYVIELELLKDYQWTVTEEEQEFREEKRKHEEYQRAFEAETKGMTPMEKFGYAMVAPLRREVLYPNLKFPREVR